MPLTQKVIDQNEIAISRAVAILGGYERAGAAFESKLLVSLRMGERQVMIGKRHVVRFLNSSDHGKMLQIDDLAKVADAYTEYRCAWQIFRYDLKSCELVVSPGPSGARNPYELRLLIEE